jgi:hypothetical protein
VVASCGSAGMEEWREVDLEIEIGWSWSDGGGDSTICGLEAGKERGYQKETYLMPDHSEGFIVSVSVRSNAIRQARGRMQFGSRVQLDLSRGC